MRITGRSKDGTEWYIQSEGDVVVETCPGCGFPMRILNPSAPEIKTVRLRIGKTTKDISLEVLREFLHKHPELSFCSFCKFTNRQNLWRK
jgi:hypothetical protein